MKMKRITSKLIALLLIIAMLSGCSSKSAEITEPAAEAAPAAAAFTPVQITVPAAIDPTATQVNTTVDGKYVSKQLMFEMLTNESLVVSEDAKGLQMYTPSGNAIMNLQFIPGVQNLGRTAAALKSVLPSFFQGGQVGDIADGYMFGYRAKNFPFTYADENGSQIYGIMSITVVNKSLYWLTTVFGPNVSDSESTLIQNVIGSMRILEPKTVDATTKKATYKDPYAEYQKVYYVDTYEYYDLSYWEDLPYVYYQDWDGDYALWDDPTYYEPDWDYYADDSEYSYDWDWGWDEEDDWTFYEDYSEYYEAEYYEEYPDYYEDFEYTESYELSYEESTSYEYYDASYESYEESTEEYYEESAEEYYEEPVEEYYEEPVEEYYEEPVEEYYEEPVEEYYEEPVEEYYEEPVEEYYEEPVEEYYDDSEGEY